ncbi:hypothetical protein N665_0318s0022 [Sinapis alba]|nr:hypothetical protein N665_0318s0022 [Sinapis alba]
MREALYEHYHPLEFSPVIPLEEKTKLMEQWYFICGMPGHCTQGMKLEVNVIPTANAAPTAPLPNSVPSLNAQSPSSVLPTQPLLPLNPSPSSSTPLPSSSLPLLPAQSPALSPVGTSLPLFPGSPSTSSSTTTKTVGSFPSSATGTTADLSGAEAPPVDSSSARSLVLGFGFTVALMLSLF